MKNNTKMEIKRDANEECIGVDCAPPIISIIIIIIRQIDSEFSIPVQHRNCIKAKWFNLKVAMQVSHAYVFIFPSLLLIAFRFRASFSPFHLHIDLSFSLFERNRFKSAHPLFFNYFGYFLSLFSRSLLSALPKAASNTAIGCESIFMSFNCVSLGMILSHFAYKLYRNITEIYSIHKWNK